MPLAFPAVKQPPTTREPRNMLLYGRTKVGKSTIASMLPSALHADLEGGTELISTRRVRVTTPEELIEFADALPAQWRANPFRFLVIDTVDAIDDWGDPIALARYRSLPMGKTFGGSTLRELDRGAGYYYLREAFKGFLAKLMANAMWSTIFIGHVRDKYSDGTKIGTDVSEVDIDLAGKAKSIMCARMDAIGYAFRDALGVLKVSFASKDQVNCGIRSPYLAGKVFTFTTPARAEDWKQIYPDSWDKVPVVASTAVPASPQPAPAIKPSISTVQGNSTPAAPVPPQPISPSPKP